MTKPLDPLSRNLATMKSLIGAALAGHHDRTAKFSHELALSFKGMAEESVSRSEQAQLMEFAQWIDGQLAHLNHIKNQFPGASRNAQRAAELSARTDPVQNLFARRIINAQELAACRRIEGMFEAIHGGLGVKARDYRDSRVDNSGSYDHPMDRISYFESFEITMVWRPWAEQMRAVDAGTGFIRRKKPRRADYWHLTWQEYLDIRMSGGGSMDAALPYRSGPEAFLPWATPPEIPKEEYQGRSIGLTCYELVRRVLIDRQTIRSIEKGMGVRNGRLTNPLVMALRHYNALSDAAHDNGHLWETAVKAELEDLS